MDVLSCGPEAWTISGISDAISPHFISKPYAACTVAHIIGTAPILERVRPYGITFPIMAPAEHLCQRT